MPHSPVAGREHLPLQPYAQATSAGRPRRSSTWGGITTARGQEHLALLFLGVAAALGTYTFNLNVVRGEGQEHAS